MASASRKGSQHPRLDLGLYGAGIGPMWEEVESSGVGGCDRKGPLSRPPVVSGFSDKGFPTRPREMFAEQGPRYSGFHLPVKRNCNFTFSSAALGNWGGGGRGCPHHCRQFFLLEKKGEGEPTAQGKRSLFCLETFGSQARLPEPTNTPAPFRLRTWIQNGFLETGPRESG